MNAIAAPPVSGTWRDPSRWLLACFLLLLVAADLSIAVSQLSLGACLLLLLFRWVRTRTAPPSTGLEGPVLALALWALGMIPLSTDPGQSLVFYKRFFLFAALWCGAAAADGERSRRLAAGALLGGAVLICLYGLARLWSQTGSLFKARLGEMSNPMTSGCLLMLVLLVGGGLLLTPGLGRRARWWLGAACTPVALGLVLTMTRSAELGLLVGVAAMLLVARRRLFLIFAAATLVALLVVPQVAEMGGRGQLTGRLTTEYLRESRSTNHRLQMWAGGWRIIRERPLVGVGDRDLLEVMPAYYGDEDTVYYGHLHSNPVMLAVIWGVPGFLLAMAFFAATLVQPLRRWRRLGEAGRRAPPWARGWLLGAVGASCGFFAAGLTEWYFGDAESMLLFLAIVGVALGPAVAGERDHAREH